MLNAAQRDRFAVRQIGGSMRRVVRETSPYMSNVNDRNIDCSVDRGYEVKRFATQSILAFEQFIPFDLCLIR
ncbi:hypothetical protein CEE69_09715 [Rhodopirellula bahusiensis]|uniref:Uncharacterized protein n=1 Tax=Rhodopirellula bahusiensis TaxID=2014065 RepID=A0A2G1W8F0_9BACT|nr:hypothetical protein CEE69_09715 [Rhodopirellula bahusiensis]